MNINITINVGQILLAIAIMVSAYYAYQAVTYTEQTAVAAFNWLLGY